MSRGRRRSGRPHPYTPSNLLAADHNGRRPCICGRPEKNGVHAQAAVEQVDAAQAEHLRRIGETR